MMENKYIRCVFLVIVIFVILSCFILFCLGEKKKDVCFDSVCFDVNIADNLIERERGLMNVEYLDERSGMLFIYENSGNYSFWMKNTMISLDIIWIDEDFNVVYIKSVFPCETEVCEVYCSSEKSKYVLEINYGLAEKYNISVGEKVDVFV